jgi:hypothetical protein
LPGVRVCRLYGDMPTHSRGKHVVRIFNSDTDISDRGDNWFYGLMTK